MKCFTESQSIGNKAREASIDIISEAFEDEHHGTQLHFVNCYLLMPIQDGTCVEHYCEAVGALVSSLLDKPELLQWIVEYVFCFSIIWYDSELHFVQ